MIRQALPTRIRSLGDREVEAIISTNELARDGHIVEPAGGLLESFFANPIILWEHNPASPIGRASNLTRYSDRIAARISFAPAGISACADEACGLVKAGIVNTMSIGFDIIESTPLDPRKGARGGLHITKWELLECSFVSVPADTGAVVTARSYYAPPRSLLTYVPGETPAHTAARIRAFEEGQRLAHIRGVYRADDDFDYRRRQAERLRLQR
jgi:HK97 family phage prohead protease